MIKIDAVNNCLEFQGNKAELLAELGTLIRQFVKRGVINKEDLELITETAFLSDEEIQERALKSLEHLSDALDKMIFGSDNHKEDLKEELKKAMEKEWENE